MAEYRILIVEDDVGLNRGIALALQNPDYEFWQAATLAEARQAWREQKFSLILLDINLPDGNGLKFLQEVRRESAVPVIMLTAKDMEIDEVTGFSLGADDYITKPFSLMVLRARVERMLRRAGGRSDRKYEKGRYRFDFDALEFWADGRELTLSRTEQKLLRLFVEHPGQVLTREVLVDRIWTDGAQFVDENALSVTVGRLRKKLSGRSMENPIQTVYGLGYVWEKKGEDIQEEENAGKAGRYADTGDQRDIFGKRV